MKKYYCTTQLSDNISETPEGFLLCRDVAITRAGDLEYNPDETPIKPGIGNTVITRTIDDIHDPNTIASFEGKPVTMGHPEKFVNPDNWKELTIGTLHNVRAGTDDNADKLLTDLLITDRNGIKAVKTKQLRNVSCGYEANYIEDAPGRGRHTGIIGNHLALVQACRAVQNVQFLITHHGRNKK